MQLKEIMWLSNIVTFLETQTWLQFGPNLLSILLRLSEWIAGFSLMSNNEQLVVCNTNRIPRCLCLLMIFPDMWVPWGCSHTRRTGLEICRDVEKGEKCRPKIGSYSERNANCLVNRESEENMKWRLYWVRERERD